MSGRRAAARLGLLLLALGTGVAAPARAADVELPSPTGYVNDRAGVMDEPSRAKLESFLDQVQRRTGAQFAVLTVPTTAPLTPDEYKVKVFEAWRPGTAERDDGLLLLVAIAEREAKFETGYGLEGTLPDGWQSRMFRREMAPRFREGDFAGGITAGLLASAARVAKEAGVTLEWDGSELRYDDDSDAGGLPAPLILVILFLIVMIVAANLRAMRRSGRGRWGGFGGWGGGWGGGFGGGFGGGGFGGGGRGFGGFGGGRSGGGGGGGRW